MPPPINPLKINRMKISQTKEDALDPNCLTSEADIYVESPGTVAKLLRWVTKSGLAVMDQGLISGSNFLVGILLARWLAPEAYGAYALAFSILLLLLLFYQSLMLEPMTVFGAGVYRYSLRSYFRRLLSMHGALAGAIFVVLGIACVIARYVGPPGPLSGALVGITFAAPCILLFWLARRVFYSGLSLVPAASSAGIYFVVLIAGMYLARRFGLLSVASAFGLMGVSALLTSAVLLWHLRKALVRGDAVPGNSELWRRHWGYGRWALAGVIAGWVPTYIYYPMLSSFSGMASAGELKALTNLALPLFQTYAALSMLYIPHIARMREEGTPEAILAFTGKISMMFVAGAMVYWALLLSFSSTAFHLLYNGKYTQVGYLVPLVALESILWSATCGPAIALRGIESPSSVFWARSAASFVSIAVGIVITRFYGIHGALWAMAASSGAALFFVVVLLRRKLAGDIGTTRAISDCAPVQ
jgi:O-antigen/teichoic acid export membrane protein